MLFWSSLEETVPLAVAAGAADPRGQLLQLFEHADFDLQLGDRAGGGGLVDDLFLGFFDFGVGGVVEFLQVVEGVDRQAGKRFEAGLGLRLREAALREGRFRGQLAAAAKRLVDGLQGMKPVAAEGRSRRGRPRALTTFVFQGLGFD